MDGQQFLVEDARRKARIDPFVVEQLEEILFLARAAAGDDGHVHPGRHGIQHFQIKAGAAAVGVNAQPDLSSTFPFFVILFKKQLQISAF